MPPDGLVVAVDNGAAWPLVSLVGLLGLGRPGRMLVYVLSIAAQLPKLDVDPAVRKGRIGNDKRARVRQFAGF